MRTSYLPAIGPGTAMGRWRRTALLIAIVLAHLLAILWLATRRDFDRPSPQGSMTMIDVSGRGDRPAAVTPPVDPVPPKLPVPPIALQVQEFVPPQSSSADEIAQAVPGSGGDGAAGGCALAKEIGFAIQASPSAMRELAIVPPGFRTSADAVMLWDGRWLATPGIDAEALRAATIDTIVAAVPECRDAPIIGPQLIPVPEPGRTTMVVFGSGAWRWSDLVKPGTCPANESGSCGVEVSPFRLSRPAQ